MTITNGYADLGKVKARLWPTGSTTDTLEDTMLEGIITAASRLIDDYTGRKFYVNAADETRYYKPINHDCVLPDDIVSITSLKTDDDGDRVFETTWATTDYELLPYNGALDGVPYNHITAAVLGNYSFPCGYRSVQIVGKFGWPAVPAVVQEACIIQVERLFRRKDAPFGVVGGGEMGQATVLNELDPDVKLLLRTWVRMV